jgi:hypothetical protein
MVRALVLSLSLTAIIDGFPSRVFIVGAYRGDLFVGEESLDV